MTELETAKIIATLREYYRDVESSTVQAKVKAWHMILRDYDYRLVQAAAVAFVANDRKGFMPSPGQIIERLRDIAAPNALSAQEAWGLVAKAVARTDWFNPSKQFDRLPPEVQSAVGSPNMLKEWGMVDVDTFNTVIYSNFLRAYETHRKRRETFDSLPEGVKGLVLDMSEKLSLEAKHEN